jgi:hypothetical protein
MIKTKDICHALVLLPALLAVGVAPSVRAHSFVKLQSPGYVTEGSNTSGVYQITHACGQDPVLAQSFMMPTLNPILKRQGGGKIADADGSGTVDLFDVITSGTLIGTFQPQIDRSVFRQTQLKVDDPSLNNPVGFSGTRGVVPDKFYAETRLTVNTVFFVTNSCVRELWVHPVGAEICKFTQVPDEGDANIWMEETTSKFPNAVHGVGENALRIRFVRDQSFNPLKKRCKGGYIVDVYASKVDIDTHLPIPGIWPAP